LTTHLLCAAAKLNIADELADGQQTPEELASMAGHGSLGCLERKRTPLVTRRQFACSVLC
jgi:hypothetical protein